MSDKETTTEATTRPMMDPSVMLNIQMANAQLSLQRAELIIAYLSNVKQGALTSELENELKNILIVTKNV